MGTKVTVDTVTNLQLPSALPLINDNFSVVADEFDSVVYRDGSTVMTGNLDMNDQRIINVADGVADTDLATIGQVEDIANSIAQGPQGIPGPSNVLSAGTATKLSPGSTPTISITGTSPTQVLNVGLVTGDTGNTGTTGPAGYTSTDTWAHLNAITPSGGAGSTGFAIGPDAGTHTDANGATSILNTGQFTYQASPAGWIRIGAATSPTDSAAVDAREAARIVSAVNSGFGNAAGVKLLMTQHGAKTYRSGSSTDIDTIVPLIGPGTLVQPSFSWNGTNGAPGAALRTIATADGLKFGSQTGFNYTISNITDTTTICFDVFFKMPALKTTAAAPAGTYTSVANMTADTANLFEGDIVKVTGGAVTTLTPDIPVGYIGNVEFTDDTQMTQGYYVKEATVLSRMDQNSILVLQDTTAPTTKLINIHFDRRGQIRIFWNDAGGTNFGIMRTLSKDALATAQAGMCHMKLELDPLDGHLRLWLNGIECCDIFGAIPNFTPNRLLVNGGPSRGGNAIAPVSGQAWTMGALCITQGLDFTQRRLGSNALAKIYGTPEQAWSPIMNLIIVSGNSRGDGFTNPVTSSALPDPTTGWGYEIVRSQSNISDADNPSQAPLERVYSPRNFLNPTSIGPVMRASDTAGNLVATLSHLVSNAYNLESVEWGIFSELFKYPEAKSQDWAIIGVCVGNTSLGELNKISATRPYLFSLSGSTVDSTAYRDLANKAVTEMGKLARRRGQKLQLFAVYGEGGAKTTPIPTNPTPLAADLASGPFYTQLQYGAAYEASARQWINNELVPLLGAGGRQPIYIRISDPLAIVGANNMGMNIAPNYFDNQHRVLEGNKDTAFRFVWAGEMYSIAWPTTHWPTLTYKTVGARIGWSLGKAGFTDTDTTSLGVKSVSIVSGKIRCFLTGPVSVVDTAPNSKPSIKFRQTTGGIDTFGWVLEPVSGGRTITAVDNTNCAAATPYIDISVSGGGAVSGDRINATGSTAFWTNYRSTTRVFASFNDQDWTVANTATGLASSAAKLFTLSANPVEITPWLNVSSHVVP